jgi:hypothetical protein
MNRSGGGIISQGENAREHFEQALHYSSVSVPLQIPTHPGECKRVEVPFGPPVVHTQPELTQPPEEILQGKTSTSFSSSSFNPHNQWFFRTDGPSIFLQSRSSSSSGDPDHHDESKQYHWWSEQYIDDVIIGKEKDEPMNTT